MRLLRFSAMALVSLTVAGAGLAGPAEGAPMQAPIVFFDIAGPDLASQAAFYKAIFGWEIAADGRMTVPTASPLRVEPPSTGPIAERVIYVGVPDINATLAKITAGGGSVVIPRTVVPGVVILALFKDPAGNRMGIVEMDGDKPKVP